MTEIISIASGKGGVGKTFFSINLTAALAKLNKKVLLIDTNLTTPNISVNLRLPEYSKTIHDVLKDEATLREVILKTDYDFDVVPASLSLRDLIGTDPERLSEVLYEVTGLYDYIILDTSAGLGRETLSAIKASEKVIIITIPEKAALVDAYKVIKSCDALMIPIQGTILNRVPKKTNISILDVEAYLSRPVLGIVHEDHSVRKSLEAGIPLTVYKPESIAAKDIMKIAAKLVGVEIKEQEEPKKKFDLLEKILALFKI